MPLKFSVIFTSLIALFFAMCLPMCGYAAIDIPGGATIGAVSISVDAGSGGDAIETSRAFGFQILSIVKLIISGLALVYIILMGGYMIVFSDSEEKIKTQKSQFMYMLFGFLFLNVPGLLYNVFFGSPKSGEVLGTAPTNGWTDVAGGMFWESSILDSTVSGLISFFEVFIFGAAVLVFTWGLFLIILSGGDEERVKSGKNRIVYGILGLIFLGFVKAWAYMLSAGDFGSAGAEVWTIGQKLFAIGIYFAGPIAIFFLIFGAYYYITSGGDEERTKKGKSIIVNTFIATLILLASYSFLSELVNFSL